MGFVIRGGEEAFGARVPFEAKMGFTPETRKSRSMRVRK
jgi:hypothetical protein